MMITTRFLRIILYLMMNQLRMINQVEDLIIVYFFITDKDIANNILDTLENDDDN